MQSAKTGSVVVARYTDPTAKLKDNTMHPYIVVNPEALPRVVWIGSAETWRLREYREAYHERFWTKMVRYAAAKSKGPVTKPIRLEAATVVSANRYMEVEAKIEGGDGQPLAKTARPGHHAQAARRRAGHRHQAADPDDAPAGDAGRLVLGAGSSSSRRASTR